MFIHLVTSQRTGTLTNSCIHSPLSLTKTHSFLDPIHLPHLFVYSLTHPLNHAFNYLYIQFFMLLAHLFSHSFTPSFLLLHWNNLFTPSLSHVFTSLIHSHTVTHSPNSLIQPPLALTHTLICSLIHSSHLWSVSYSLPHIFTAFSFGSFIHLFHQLILFCLYINSFIILFVLFVY